jgi:hypothetical protein
MHSVIFQLPVYTNERSALYLSAMIHLSQSLIGVVYSPYLVSINAASALTELPNYSVAW